MLSVPAVSLTVQKMSASQLAPLFVAVPTNNLFGCFLEQVDQPCLHIGQESARHFSSQTTRPLLPGPEPARQYQKLIQPPEPTRYYDTFQAASRAAFSTWKPIVPRPYNQPPATFNKPASRNEDMKQRSEEDVAAAAAAAEEDELALSNDISEIQTKTSWEEVDDRTVVARPENTESNDQLP